MRMSVVDLGFKTMKYNKNSNPDEKKDADNE